MNLKPGSIGWALQALRNAQAASKRASDVLLENGLTGEASMAKTISDSAGILTAQIEESHNLPPRDAA